MLSLANGDKTSGSNIAKKMFWWNSFCNSYKDYNKHCSKELFCNNFSQDGTLLYGLDVDFSELCVVASARDKFSTQRTEQF